MIEARDGKALPHRYGDRIIDRHSDLVLERLNQRRPAHISAHHRDGVAALAGNVADHLRNGRLRDLREGEIVLKPQVALGRAGKARFVPVGHNPPLHVIAVRGHQPDVAHRGGAEDFAESKDRGAGRNASRSGDALAQPLVALEAEPAGRGAVPGDRVDLGVCEKLCRSQDLRVVELAECPVGERDLEHSEAGEMRSRLRNAGEHGDCGRLEDGVRGRRQHAEADGARHLDHLP
jgi:hypothetical protein